MVNVILDASIQKESRVDAFNATGSFVDSYRWAIDTNALTFVRLISSDIVEAGSTDTDIVATSHSAYVGDIIEFTSGTLNTHRASVYSISTNSFTLCQKLSATPAPADTFKIFRFASPLIGSDGSLFFSPFFSSGNVISEGPRAAATIEAAGTGGVTLINYVETPIVSVQLFSGLTSIVEISFDGGSTWMVLYAGASPSLEFGDRGRKLEADVKVRKSGSTTVTGGTIIGWGMI